MMTVDEMDEIIKFCELIRVKRNKAGMTMTELAKKTRLNESLISKIERGESFPNLSTTLKINKHLKIFTVDYDGLS